MTGGEEEWDNGKFTAVTGDGQPANLPYLDAALRQTVTYEITQHPRAVCSRQEAM